MSPKGKKWKSPEKKWDEIKKLLIDNGGIQDESVSETSSEVSFSSTNPGQGGRGLFN